MSNEPMIDDGGTAFPVHSERDGNGNGILEGCPGMSLRDYFAAKALVGFCQHQGWIGYVTEPSHRAKLFKTYSRDAYDFADAMLAARNCRTPM